jgi:ABC-type branched-subunit amino acid transport system substrate-binding protein
MKFRSYRLAIIFAVLALVAAACNGDEVADPADPGEPGEPGEVEDTPADDDVAVDDDDDVAVDDDLDLPASCDNEQGVDDETIRVAVLTDLSGPISALGGIDHGAAFQAHFEAINAEGGIDGRMVEVDLRDMRYDPVETASQYEEVRTDAAMVPVILGSAAIDAIGTDMEEDCLITFMGSPNGQLAQKHESVFAPSTTYGHEILNTISWIIEDEGHTDATFALAFQGDAFGEAVSEAAEFAAEEFGFELVTTVSFGPADQDVTAQAQDLIAADPDYVIYGGLPGQLAGLSATAFAAESEMQFITQTGGWTPAILATPAGPALEANVLVSTSYGAYDGDEPGLQRMREEIEEHSNAAPGQAALTGYAAALVTAETLRIASENGDLTLGGIRRAAMSVSGFDSEGVIPALTYGQFEGEPRIGTHESRVYRPDADSVGGVELVVDYFESDASARYVEPEI